MGCFLMASGMGINDCNLCRLPTPVWPVIMTRKDLPGPEQIISAHHARMSELPARLNLVEPAEADYLQEGARHPYHNHR